MVDELRSTLDRHAALVTAQPDPYARVVVRHRRHRRRRLTALAAVAVLLVLSPAVWLINRPQPYLPVADPPSAALLASPTRGSLAADQPYLVALRGAAAHTDNGGSWSAGDPALMKVLFAGDVDGRIIAVVARLDGEPRAMMFEGNPGDDPIELNPRGLGMVVGAVMEIDLPAAEPTDRTVYLLLGPTGAVYEQATMQYTHTGAVRRWERVAADADYLALSRPGKRFFRVLLADQVLLETESRVPPGDSTPVTVDPQPLGGRGRPMPAAAQQVAAKLAAMTGRTGPDVTYRVLWSDEVDMLGTTTGRAQVATVQMVTEHGGGPYTTGAVDPGDLSFRDHPRGFGAAGDLAHTLLAVRLPWYEAESDRLQIIAPPTAVRAEVVRGTASTSVDLVDGAGGLTVPLDSQLTIRAYDAAGVLLVTTDYTDRRTGLCDGPFACPPSTADPAPTRSADRP